MIQTVQHHAQCRRCGISIRNGDYCNRHAYVAKLIINGYKL